MILFDYLYYCVLRYAGSKWIVKNSGYFQIFERQTRQKHPHHFNISLPSNWLLHLPQGTVPSKKHFKTKPMTLFLHEEFCTLFPFQGLFNNTDVPLCVLHHFFTFHGFCTNRSFNTYLRRRYHRLKKGAPKIMTYIVCRNMALRQKISCIRCSGNPEIPEFQVLRKCQLQKNQIELITLNNYSLILIIIYSHWFIYSEWITIWDPIAESWLICMLAAAVFVISCF